MKEKPIATHSVTKELITTNNFQIKKSLGQNFLVDPHVINKILDGAEICEKDIVIEIGAGMGGLTEQLAKRARAVCTIEIDTSLIPILKNSFSDYENIWLIHGDILKLDLKSYFLKEREAEPTIYDDTPSEKAEKCKTLFLDSFFGENPSIKLVGNLPYYISTPIIMSLLEGHIPFKSITVMLQKEVAQRMTAKPSTKSYGSLTLAVSYFTSCKTVAQVPRNCFIPRPNVDSCVIRLDRLDKPGVEVHSQEFLFEIIRAAFSTRRKTLVNALFSAPGFSLPGNPSKEELAEKICSCGFDPNIRGEALTLEQFGQLANIF